MMSNRIRHICIATLALTTTLTVGNALADVAVVVAATSPVAALTNDQAADLFMGRTTKLPSGVTAMVIDQTDGSSARDEFYSKVANKSSDEMRAYWAKQVFSGKAQPPQAVSGDAAVKSAVAANPTAVGYIGKSAVDGSVRVILMVH